MSTSTQLFTNRQHLTTRAYGNSANLDARKSIYQYQQTSFDLVEWVLGHAAWNGAETVLDVGCGTGQYLAQLARRGGMRLVGFDLSRGMLADLARQWHGALLPHLAVADAQALPLADACCDVVLAMHMLYHVPDIAQAAREFRRVLRPGGVLLALTNSEQHLQKLQNMLQAAVHHAAGPPVALPGRFATRFSLENGAAPLQAAFQHVEQHEASNELAVPDATPVLAYCNSVRQAYEAVLPAGASWDAVLAEVERVVAAEIAVHGAFRVVTKIGLFVCR
jgi:ubiquinone/menaquinone biosynthesis C-methylase UbiE